MGTEQHSLLAALEPDFSVVVEACAGSGKTWLLVSRIVRLLLAGVAPSEILAITFTRKGAREMQQRLNAWLQELATHPDDEWVRNFLRERGIKNADELLPQARGLYEKVLAARPGLKINTFHGWFADLLQRAPLQAGVAKGFALTETVHALEQEAWQRYALSLAGQARIALPRSGGFRVRRLFVGRRSDGHGDGSTQAFYSCHGIGEQVRSVRDHQGSSGTTLT